MVLPLDVNSVVGASNERVKLSLSESFSVNVPDVDTLSEVLPNIKLCSEIVTSSDDNSGASFTNIVVGVTVAVTLELVPVVLKLISGNTLPASKKASPVAVYTTSEPTIS